MSDYERFLNSKRHMASDGGFKPKWIPDFLFDFQKSLVEWAIRKGRAAIFADCGLGKTAMQLVWAQNVIIKTSKPVLILTPLAVGPQTVHEARKFDVSAFRSLGHEIPVDPMVIVTNYERLHYFDPDMFAGIVCDESSILKNFDGKTKASVIEFMRTIRYRLLCTATAAPNDYVELGNSSEALGEMGFQDMVSRFFHKETSKDRLGWGRTKYVMRRHAERDFWRWVCSWGRAIRRPSDLGFEDHEFILPELVTEEHVVSASQRREGMLFDMPAVTLPEQREERRRSLPDRCERAATLIAKHDCSIAWCHLNDEGNILEEMIPNSVQVSGANTDSEKEELFEAFAVGQIRRLITKPSIAGWGLNWQHCAHQTFFPSHSFEQYYQAVRRSWRFGQKKRVKVDIIASDGEAGVMANLNRKAEQTETMFSQLVALMNDPKLMTSLSKFHQKEEVPTWL